MGKGEGNGGFTLPRAWKNPTLPTERLLLTLHWASQKWKPPILPSPDVEKSPRTATVTVTTMIKKRAIFSLWGLKFKIKKFCANSEHLYVLCESWVKKQVKLCRELVILLFWKFYFTPHSPPRDLKILPSPETPISQPSPQSTKFCHPHEMQTRAHVCTYPSPLSFVWSSLILPL